MTDLPPILREALALQGLAVDDVREIDVKSNDEWYRGIVRLTDDRPSVHVFVKHELLEEPAA